MAGTVNIAKIMMATEAFHPGTQMDISSERPDLAFIQYQRGGVFIGQWVFGFGFLEVRFPIKTTRPLTEPEADYYQRGGVLHSNGIKHKFRRSDFWVRNLSFESHDFGAVTYRNEAWTEPGSGKPMGAGWYYADETWSHLTGPFPTRWEAELGLSYYMMFLEGQLRGRLCPHNPMKLLGQPLGQYRCPICMMMCVAGVPHLNPSPLNPDRLMNENPEDIFWLMGPIEEKALHEYMANDMERRIVEGDGDGEPEGILDL